MLTQVIDSTGSDAVVEEYVEEEGGFSNAGVLRANTLTALSDDAFAERDSTSKMNNGNLACSVRRHVTSRSGEFGSPGNMGSSVVG